MHAWIQKTTLPYAFVRAHNASSKWLLPSQRKACSTRSNAWCLKNMIVCINRKRGRQGMLLCQKIKLEVSKQDAATLEFMQGKCRGLYNWWVMKLRDGEKWPGVYEAKKTLQQSRQHDPELKWVYGKLLHEVYFRLG